MPSRPRTPGSDPAYPKLQRGVFSEVLATDITANDLASALAGPEVTRQILTLNTARPPSASGFSHRPKTFRFGEKDVPSYAQVAPKVCEPYVPPPGRPPRRVVIERKRREYGSLDITTLLLERGIDLSVSLEEEGAWFAPEHFDDTEYDCCTPEEWMQLGFDPVLNEYLPLPAKGLYRDKDQCGYWEICRVSSYDSEAKLFRVSFECDVEGVTKEVTRVNLLFDAEDPQVFADRLEKAYADRRRAETIMKYHFYIDNMPTDEVPGLDVDQAARLLEASQNSGKTRGQDLDTQSLLKEVQLDFARTMNRITFDHQILEGSNKNGVYGELRALIEEGALSSSTEWLGPSARWQAMISIPEYSFAEAFSDFCFGSLYIKPEIVHCLNNIRQQCNDLVEKNSLFGPIFAKPFRLDEFRQFQKTSLHQCKGFIKDTWVNALHKLILKEFEGVGKGWFNMHETDKESYEYGKLKKFLTIIRLMMQDTLRFLVERSVQEYVSSVQKATSIRVDIVAANRVTNTVIQLLGETAEELNGLEEANYQDTFSSVGFQSFNGTFNGGVSKPSAKEEEAVAIFVLDVGKREGGAYGQEFAYSSEPSQFVEAALEAFDCGLASLADIPQLERLVLPHLFRTQGYRQVLAAVGAEEKWICEARTKVNQCLTDSLPCLSNYLFKMEDFEDLLCAEPTQIANDIECSIPALEDENIASQIRQELDFEKEMLQKIPETIQVGLFSVSCKDIRRRLAEKHSKTAQLLLEVLQRRLQKQMTSCLESFEQIYVNLRRTPKNIEELTEVKRFIETVPAQVSNLNADVGTNMTLFDLLEGSFQYKLTTEDHKQRWKLYGAAKKTNDVIAQVTISLDKDQARFLVTMEKQQAEFKEAIDDLENIVYSFFEYQDLNKYAEIAENVESVNERLTNIASQAKLFQTREGLFKKDATDYSRVQRLTADFAPYSNLWLTAASWLVKQEKWYSGAFQEIDAASLEKEVFTGVKLLFKVCRFFADKNLPGIYEIAEKVRKELDEFRPFVPLIVALRTEGIAPRHWKEISAQCGHEVHPEMENFTLNNLISEEIGLQKHLDVIQGVAERASKEYAIETSLQRMKHEWESIAFDCKDQFRNTGTFVLKGADIVSTLLDEHIVTTQAMQFSPFKEPFADRIDTWSEQLVYMSETLDEWLKCQRSWLYLQPIFDSPDIMKQLPAESKRFKSVDTAWRNVMKTTHENPHALTCLSREGLLDKWMEANRNLDIVQKGLDDYLETKRSIFSRFYFLSNDELLEILSQTKDPTGVQPFLRKVFENMNLLEFSPELTVTAMFSDEGEMIPFLEPFAVKGKNVELWMCEVEAAMFKGVRAVLHDAIAAYEGNGSEERNDWISNHAAQAVLNGSQVHWTAEVENGLDCGSLQECFDMLGKQLMNTVALVRSGLSKERMTAVGSLIVLDVHQKDIVENLLQGNVQGALSFEWISQLRYYWDTEDQKNYDDMPDLAGEKSREDMWVKLLQTVLPYGYEYLGNTTRLVITPLTDQCYMTLMGAQLLNLGGAPTGPAGTGKTETTKDLAKAVARHCVVFNCSEGMDYIMVGKFFKGLASSGSWCCFDEFNRINVEVLSVIAQQLMVLFSAKSELSGFSHTKEVEFEGTTINIRPTFNVYITMNPGYAGRTELPDNLKALFRPVAMMVPDYTLIGEIMLYSFGFESARDLAKKMTVTFRLSSEQLSSQDHYDYGMRAVRSVINAAGLLKGKEAQKAGSVSEDQLLLRALRDVNVPKFLRDDLPLFENIISDLFPGVEKPIVDRKLLMQHVSEHCKASALQPVTCFLDKVVQLYDTIRVRHGLMLVGPAGGGKTCTWRTLASAETSAAGNADFLPIIAYTLHPKSVTLGQLYGEFDEATHEWTDGILAATCRTAVRDESASKHWLMFDGPVDAIWIESMNTVLDDNKKLCLNSGEIIQLTNAMTMMFEVEDLAVASPATVSRCGMVYMEPAALGLTPLMESWLGSLPSGFPDNLLSRLRLLSTTVVQKAVRVARKSSNEVFPTVDHQLCSGLLCLLDTFFDSYRPNELHTPSAEVVSALYQHVDQLFFFSLIWSIGASIDVQGRQKFSESVWSWVPMAGAQLFGVPELAFLYDYAYRMEESKWIKWMDTIPEFSINPKDSFENIVVPTLDSVRVNSVLGRLLLAGKHAMLPGPTGTGKSVNVSKLLRDGMPDDVVTIFMSFSAQTHVNQTQDFLDSKFDKRRRGVYGPPTGKKCIVFIDDLNLPKKEKFGAQPPLELIRQWFNHGGWYNRKDLSFHQIVDVTMTAAMGPPGGGRQFISARLSRRYHCIACTELTEGSITSMFTTLVNHFFRQFEQKIRDVVPMLVPSTLEIFQRVRKELLPTPAKTHYTFNLRDMWKVFQGISSLNERDNSEKLTIVKCWMHENLRVFSDRFINKDDIEWFKNELLLMAEARFSLRRTAVFPNHGRLLFGDFLEGSSTYREIENLNQLHDAMEHQLDEYNDSQPTPMYLVMFLDACEHVSRICRVLRQPRGNCLLLGVGGSGRQSLTRLSAYIREMKCSQIEISKGYGMSEWRDDVKSCLLLAGVEDKRVCFLFCDTQILVENQVEDMNSVLNSGEIPNLYRNDDMDLIMQGCTAMCHDVGLQPSRNNIFECYLQRVKQNIHIVLPFSPLSEMFRTRLRMFPSLVNCCTMNWFHPWPPEALLSVARRQLTPAPPEFPGVELYPTELFEGVLRIFAQMHPGVEAHSKRFLHELRRFTYVTPTSYLELLRLFQDILEKKRKNSAQLQNRFQTGVNKLDDAQMQVELMKIQLIDMQPRLEETQREVGEMMVKIDHDKKDADATKEVVAKEEIECQHKAAECVAIKDDAKRDLSEAVPALEQATDCLKKLRVDQVREVKAFGKPPPGVILTMEAVCVMFGVPPVKKMGDRPGVKIDDYWDAAQKELLKDPKKLLDDLMTYEKDNIPDAVVKKVQTYIERDDFEPAQIKKSSVACEAICMWVRAMYKYHWVAKAVEPKRVRLREAEELYDSMVAKLKQAQENLQTAVSKVQRLEAEFNEAVAKQEQLAKEIEDCQMKMERAGKLIGGLGGERQRWTDQVTTLAEVYELLPGDSLLCAGMVAYSGPFNSEFRVDLEKDWVKTMGELKIKHSEHTALRVLLGNSVKIQQWSICGLPDDSLSVENGIIISTTRRWPLMIDPQGQANRFIRNLGRSTQDGVDIVKQNQQNFLRTLELGIQFGKWVLLEGVEQTLDNALDSVLTQAKTKDGTAYVIKLGDKSVTWTDTFRFFITTNMPNPHYSPELCAKVTLLNFAITKHGLQEQMLALVVAKESPDLEERKSQLVLTNLKMNQELQDTEDSILRLLSSSTGNILEDETLINTLSAAKKTSEDINEKVIEVEQTEKEIDRARGSYSSVAYHSATMFFTVMDMANVSPMYEFSLQWFQDLFMASIDEAQTSNLLDDRLRNLNQTFTWMLFDSVSRSLFEEDKTLFTFHLCLQIERANDRIDPAEFRFLLHGAGNILLETKNPAVKLMTDHVWNEIQVLSQLPNFKGLDYCLSSAEVVEDFIEFFEASDAMSAHLPDPWNSDWKLFQKLLFLRSARMDCLGDAIVSWVAETLGQSYVDPPAFDIRVSYRSSSALVPMIFILSPGSDPVSDVFQFADEMMMTKKLESISLGQGQGIKAQRMIEEASSKGGWVLLCNCHLCISWMPDLERIFEQMVPESVHKEFRLWLTSAPSSSLPRLVLQRGVKITNAAPKGLRSNLLRTYSQMDDNALEGCKYPQVFRRLLFGFCMFHAIVLERRRFGPIGWNIPYDFTDEDLTVCRRQLKLFLNQANQNNMPYKLVNYLGSQINYGGRVTDEHDKRLIGVILQNLVCREVVKLGDAYKFSASGVYYCPNVETRQDFMEHVKSLPVNSAPEIFGLHENARIVFQRQEAHDLLTGIIHMAPRSRLADGASSDDALLEDVANLQKITAAPFEFDAVVDKYPTSYAESMNTVLVQEVIRYNRLLSKMKDSLTEVHKALKGLVVMSEELEGICTSITEGEIPHPWSTVGFLSLKPLTSFMADLKERIGFLRSWIDRGQPAVFWLGALFFPQGCISGILQNYARRHIIAIDRVIMNYDIPKNQNTNGEGMDLHPPSDGTYIKGLHLEGCRWSQDRLELQVSRPRELFTKMPVIWFIPGVDRKLPCQTQEVYRSPLYKVLSRQGTLSTTGHSTNFVVTIDLPTTEHPDTWVRAGVALFLALSD